MVTGKYPEVFFADSKTIGNSNNVEFGGEGNFYNFLGVINTNLHPLATHMTFRPLVDRFWTNIIPDIIPAEYYFIEIIIS